MARQTRIRAVATISLIAVALGSCQFLPQRPSPDAEPEPSPQAAVIVPEVAAKDDPWSITVASWNVLNFGNRKAGLAPYPAKPNLLQQMASIVMRYKIVVLQEILNGGNSVTQGLAPLLAGAGYQCQNISAPAGRAGRRENYSVCYNTDRLVLTGTFDYLGHPYTAVNGTQQTAQQVWMRPPALASFRYQKPDNTYFSFDITTIHTKPQYSRGGRPAGTPANAPKFASVRNELQSTETNFQAVNPNRIMIGDLNADCVYYQPRFRGNEFNGWLWTFADGTKTNTAQSSSCAYDRVILNQSIQQFYQFGGVDRHGINLRIDGRRVSDHYLVWAQFGGGKKKAKRQVLSVSARAGIKKQRRLQVRRQIFLKGLNLARPIAGQQPKLYITKYVKTRNFDGYGSYPLTDVRGAPTPVQITASGDFQTPVEWTAEEVGVYNTILDMNGDGVFRASDGDVANNNNEADIIVVKPSTMHSQLASLDDNGNTRELFDADRAQNVYALGRNLPALANANLYVVAKQLLPASFTTWQAMKAAGTLNLPSVAVPVSSTANSIILGSVGRNGAGAREGVSVPLYQNVTTDEEGGLFVSAWTNPAFLFNGAVYPSTPQSFNVPDSVEAKLPEVEPGVEWDLCDDIHVTQFPGIAQACRAPTQTSHRLDTVLSGSTFPAHYGTSFNLVLDMNQNGIFDGPDVVDTYDIGDMSTYFSTPAHQDLGPYANGSPAVGEFKEYLNAHLNLNAELPITNTYDTETKQVSFRYNCSDVLDRTFFYDHLYPSAEVGFRIHNNQIYVNEVHADNTYAHSNSVYFNHVDADIGKACWTMSDEATYDGLKATNNTKVTTVAEHHHAVNSITFQSNSSVCMVGKEHIVLQAAATGALAGALIGPEGSAIGGFIGLIVGAGEAAIANLRC